MNRKWHFFSVVSIIGVFFFGFRLDAAVPTCAPGDPIAFDKAGDFKKSDEWRECRLKCTADTDCVAVKLECGTWGGVHKAYIKEFGRYIADLGPRVDCAAPPKGKVQAPTAVCTAGLCRTK